MAQQFPIIIREVWNDNLDHELNLIKQAISRFPFISFDTEFPGTVVDPPTDIPKYMYSSLTPSYTYSLMKANIDVLHLIQLGLTLFDANGDLPDFSTPCRYVWQFNFCDFDPKIHPFNKKSIELLRGKGTNFSYNKIMGIESRVFGEKFRTLLTSNVVGGIMGLGYVTWVMFHGTYDLGLLIKILTGEELPDDLESFMILVKYFFGMEVYDLKVMARSLGMQGGLVRVAKDSGVERTTGLNHQAGSDSLLAMLTFLKIGKRCLTTPFNTKKFSLKVQGLSSI